MVEKVFANSDYVATFECPQCKKTWKKDLSQLKNRINKSQVNARCSCGFTFPITLDKRRHRRKTTNLTGAFIHDRLKIRGLINIKNVSKSGIGFELNSKQFMHVGDRIVLKFNLDDQNKSFIYEEAIVKKIDGNYVGVEFCEFRHRDSLESYLEA